MTTDILLELMQAGYRWDMIDILLHSNAEHYNNINAIWANYSMNPDTKEFSIKVVEILTSIASVEGIRYILLKMIEYLNEIQAAPLEFNPEQLYDVVTRMARNRDEKAFYTSILINWIHLGYHVNIMLAIYIFNDYLYTDRCLFELKVAEYIMRQNELGNLPPEFIEYIQSLIT